jgi:hypothetical protein
VLQQRLESAVAAVVGNALRAIVGASNELEEKLAAVGRHPLADRRQSPLQTTADPDGLDRAGPRHVLRAGGTPRRTGHDQRRAKSRMD